MAQVSTRKLGLDFFDKIVDVEGRVRVVQAEMRRRADPATNRGGTNIRTLERLGLLKAALVGFLADYH